MNLKQTTTMLLQMLDRETLPHATSRIPKSYPWIALQQSDPALDLDTYQAALGRLQRLGVIKVTAETIRRGPSHEEWMTKLDGAIATLQARGTTKL